MDLKNKIEAKDTSISNLLKGQKFTIDYFQREYRWQEKHIKLLIEDLTSAFFKSYREEHTGPEIEDYQCYYLGPVVFSQDSGKKSIIDGQQRITSITLLLIYLNHRLNKIDDNTISIKDLIFSEKFFVKSFNMSDDSREPCMKALLDNEQYDINENDDETIRNMVDRYSDIAQCFPEEITDKVLPFFVTWLIECVVLVEIKAYSDDNAYTIFETMNDRGLNLTQTEMLKGFVLSRITDKKKRTEINTIWKQQMQELHEHGETDDLSFFTAWFRAKYAITIRPGKVDSENQDFENIASRFHNWFKENYTERFNLKSSDDFYTFFKIDFPFYVKQYLRIRECYETYNDTTQFVHYIGYWGIADSLQDALLLAPISTTDSEGTIITKMNMVARYIETYTVKRSVNYRKFSQTSIKYTMFNIIKSIRSANYENLCTYLKSDIENMQETWDNVPYFQLHGQNGKFVKHLLSRISGHVDSLVGKGNTYIAYQNPTGKKFEIEHIWANKFDEHRDEFDQESEFQEYRNSIGALVLLPQGTNQSFSSDRYQDKLKHYIKENTYVQTLHPNYYIKNPNFLNSELVTALQFKAHPKFNGDDIEERELLVQRICEQIWSADNIV